MDKVGKIFRDSLIQEIKSNVDQNATTFLLSYTKVSSSKMDNFRKDLRRIHAKIFVSKNRIAQIALKKTLTEPLAEKISGQTAFIWTNNDAAVISKSIIKFAKDCEGVQIRGGVLSGVLLLKEDVQRLADLPSKEILQAQLLRTMLSPLTRFAGILNAKSTELLSILKQLSEKKGGNEYV